ncbi:probable ATP-dependent RNA helicase DDX53 [Dermacentor andersoni]|uniref:probable ATP-dependent RNA helicase DDX53 n=1 Tax=Dermacentor andersoni TaxID=34620 RepID=UPI003B3A55E2
MTPSEYLVREEEPDIEDTSPNWAKLLAKSDYEKTTCWAYFRPVGKRFHTEQAELARLTAEDVGEFRSANNYAVVKYPGAPERRLRGVATNPVTSFEETFAICPEISKKVYKNGLKILSEIHNQAQETLTQGHDLVSIGRTGAGKDFAFSSPAALVHVDNQALPREERKSPTGLVLVLTRELAQQIEREGKSYRGIKSVCIYGGGSRR